MCVQYWPANKEKDEEYGGIGVSVLKEEELANFHIRTIRLYKKDDKGVRIYFYCHQHQKQRRRIKIFQR